LVSLLTAREQATKGAAGKKGLAAVGKQFRIYTSSQAHSSVEKAVRIAGFGSDNLVSVEVDANFAMRPDALAAAIATDRAAGYAPLAVVATLGTTSSCAFDPLEAIGQLCEEQQLWLHVDAAWAGTATLLPDMRWMLKGIEKADTYLFNPHKWMFVNFDCTAYFVKDKQALINTFAANPEYLKTAADSQVNNYRDWGIQLGRRFRALKLWFVMRSYGVKGLQQHIGKHLQLADYFAEKLLASGHVEIVAPVQAALVCFRYTWPGRSEAENDQLNRQLMERINSSGSAYLTHTRLNGRFVLRVVTAHARIEQRHVDELFGELEGEFKAVLTHITK
jgi:aromatic-L-amino-acid decarboxylase